MLYLCNKQKCHTNYTITIIIKSEMQERTRRKKQSKVTFFLGASLLPLTIAHKRNVSNSKSSKMAPLVKKDFTIVDYVIFVISLLIPAAIGIYYACVGSSRKTAREVLIGSSKLGIVPVALALIATYMSAISILGFPVEIYQYGTMILWYEVAYLIVFPSVAFIFLPVMYPLKLTSVYEYLELRFNRIVRRMASLIFCFQVFLYLAVVLYAPALALSSVTELGIATSMLITGLIATFYTTLGGGNAVVWTSALQMLLIVSGVLAVIIAGSTELGGIGHLWQLADQGKRIQFFDIRADPRIRHSFWSVIIGGSFTILTLFSVNQMGVQRYFTMPTLKSAQLMLLFNIPLNGFFIFLFTFVGLILYATYQWCDPRLYGLIDKADQTLPFYVMNKLFHLTGLPGLFVSALYGAGLSTLASGCTALATVLLQDIVKPIYFTIRQQQLPNTCSIGLAIIGLAFAVGSLKSTIMQISLSIFGIVGGPLLGVFIVGMFLPFCNSKGAMVGLVSSLIVTLWIGFGAIFHGVVPVLLPMNTLGCTSNVTIMNVTLNMSNYNEVYSIYGESSVKPRSSGTKIGTAALLTILISSLVKGSFCFPQHRMGLLHLYLFVLLFIILAVGQLFRVEPAEKNFHKLFMKPLPLGNSRVNKRRRYYSFIGVLVTIIVGSIVSACTGFLKGEKVDQRLISPITRRLCPCFIKYYGNIEDSAMEMKSDK
ncbi:sodium-dependent multivitamin transporter [Trichinella spiralis]|uniref:sodium-dependent multivitamin transporter n=1 Tax=Trichinella spiralis TaxID=6334 RepID=UPI0001EFDD84|nr:sodium-dependent multivitamin transporter [Trichinella spiralis]